MAFPLDLRCLNMPMNLSISNGSIPVVSGGQLREGLAGARSGVGHLWRLVLRMFVLAALVPWTGLTSPEEKNPQVAEAKPNVVKEQVRGGIVFRPENRIW